MSTVRPNFEGVGGSVEPSRAQQPVRDEPDYDEIQAAEDAIIAAIAARHPEEQAQIATRVNDAFSAEALWPKVSWSSLVLALLTVVFVGLVLGRDGENYAPYTSGAIAMAALIVGGYFVSNFGSSVWWVLHQRRVHAREVA